MAKVSSDNVATKKDPAKWARAKAKAKAKMGGKHSARAMQLATRYYKDGHRSIVPQGVCSNHKSKAPGDCCRKAVREAAKGYS